jgi:DNA-binding MarR family transcriptional regulator
MAKVKHKKAESLSPLAQLMVLFQLQRQSLEGFTVRQLAEKFNTTYITANRAFRCMKELGLCEETPDKELKLHFTSKGRELWEKAKRKMTSPVLRTFPVDGEISGEGVYVSNIDAMAEYTMLNDENVRYYAMTEGTFKALFKAKVSDYGENVFELFRYDPACLTDNDIIDPLSLYLEMRDNADDRIQIELEQLIENIKWLEE